MTAPSAIGILHSVQAERSVQRCQIDWCGSASPSRSLPGSPPVGSRAHLDAIVHLSASEAPTEAGCAAGESLAISRPTPRATTQG